MPWKERSIVEERMRFVLRLKDGESMASLCREFGISRVTGYKIYDRYKECGLEGLTDRARTPYRYANKLPAQLEAMIVSMRREKPTWGARKLRDRLLRKLPNDDSTRRIHFFASRLKYSRWIRVSVVQDQTVESLVRNLAEHLDSWGGAPLMCVFDRPKTVALKWRRNGEVTEWNPVFAYAMLEMGIGVELCWPQQPNQKGAVENLVGFVKSSFFKVRRFHDQEDLEQQLVEWHCEVNQKRPCRATGIIPAVRLSEEASRLRSLKVHPKDLALRIPVYVGPTGTVLHDGHPYSMPPEAISMPATLYLYADRVRIVAGRYEVNHPRKFIAHEGSTLAAHRAAMVAAVSGKRGKRYLKRQQLLELGEPAFLYLTEIVHRRPRQWFHDIDRLHDILQSHGQEVLRRAMEAGIKEQVFSSSYVERFLQRSLIFQEVI